MMTPDKNFKMWPSTKGRIASLKGSKEDKNHLKRMMIDAQLCYESAKRAALKSKDAGDTKGKPRGAVAPE